jgi:hypothetical protein
MMRLEPTFTRRPTLLRFALPLVLAALALAAVSSAGPGATPAVAQTRTLAGTDTTLGYFPLMVGNTWTYERAGALSRDTWTATVADRVVAPNGQTYFALDGYFGPRRLVRSSPRQVVSEHNPDGRDDNLWYLLGAPVGTAWVIQLEPLPTLGPMADCVSGSKVVVASRSEVVKVPAGEFRSVVRLDFSSPCADAGIASEWFAPGIGLVRREESSFAGPIVSELLKAEVGGQSLPRLPYTTSLELDRPGYVNNLMPPLGPDSIPTLRGLFAVRNRTSIPIAFEFGGCASLSIVLVNERGEEVLASRADDGGCCICDNIHVVRLANDSLIIPFALRLATPDAGQPLPDGRYAVVATLQALGSPALRPAATATIEVSSIH